MAQRQRLPYEYRRVSLVCGRFYLFVENKKRDASFLTSRFIVHFNFDTGYQAGFMGLSAFELVPYLSLITTKNG